MQSGPWQLRSIGLSVYRPVQLTLNTFCGILKKYCTCSLSVFAFIILLEVRLLIEGAKNSWVRRTVVSAELAYTISSLYP